MSFMFVFILLYNIKFVVPALPYNSSIDVFNDCTDGDNVWCGCSGNYVMLGMFKNPGGRDLRFIDGYKCGKPPHGFIGTNDCEDLDISLSFDSATTVKCRNGYFIQSFYKSVDRWLYNIETLKCCKFSMNNNREYYVNAEQSQFWGSDCLGQSNYGLCGISPQTYITGFKRTRNGCCNSVETYEATDELDSVYFRSIDWVPTQSPTLTPTKLPSKTPTITPTQAPTNIPSHLPTLFPTKLPTKSPTKSPSQQPTVSPSKSPTMIPTKTPSKNPTGLPSITPSNSPSQSPTVSPSKSPLFTKDPTVAPSLTPTSSPSDSTTKYPTKSPTVYPSKIPSLSPSSTPTKFLLFCDSKYILITTINATENGSIISEFCNDMISCKWETVYTESSTKNERISYTSSNGNIILFTQNRWEIRFDNDELSTQALSGSGYPSNNVYWELSSDNTLKFQLNIQCTTQPEIIVINQGSPNTSKAILIFSIVSPIVVCLCCLLIIWMVATQLPLRKEINNIKQNNDNPNNINIDESTSINDNNPSKQYLVDIRIRIMPELIIHHYQI